MSIIDTLITDRTQADVTKLKSLLSKPKAMWTQDEWSEFILARDKGAYNATDLNRVQEAMEYLAERFRAHGKKISIKRPAISGNAPSESSGIPSNFTQLEYIQSSGTQYIDTNFKPNQNTKLEIKVQTTQTTGGGIAVCDTAWQSNGFGIWVNAAGYGNATTQNVAFYGEEPIAAILDRNTLYKDGELVWTATESTFQTSFNLALMALNRNGSPQEKVTGKIYCCKIWDNGTLIRNFIPCKNDAGEVGLWDDVNREFYGNAGTGTFAAGPVVPQEMAESDIVELEYIESTGEQYVNSMVIGKSGLDVEAVMAWTSTGGDTTAIGARAGDVRFNPIHYYNGISYGYNAFVSTSKTVTALQKYTIEAHMYAGSQTITVDSEIIVSNSNANEYNTELPLYVFACNKDGVAAYHSKILLYSMRISVGEDIACDFIAARTVHGEIGLYDKVAGQFYRNAGSGTFTAGPEIGSVGVTERDYWEIGDIPSHEHMDLYLSNLNTIREVFGTLQTTPNTPDDMDELDFQEANNIEQILIDVNFVLLSLSKSLFYANEIFCGEV